MLLRFLWVRACAHLDILRLLSFRFDSECHYGLTLSQLKRRDQNEAREREIEHKKRQRKKKSTRLTKIRWDLNWNVCVCVFKSLHFLLIKWFALIKLTFNVKFQMFDRRCAFTGTCVRTCAFIVFRRLLDTHGRIGTRAQNQLCVLVARTPHVLCLYITSNVSTNSNWTWMSIITLFYYFYLFFSSFNFSLS